MTHTFTFFLLNKIQAKKYMTEDEYENVAYSLEIFLINIFKTVQVYVIAYLLGVLFETFIMNLPYVLLRWHAGVGTRSQPLIALFLVSQHLLAFHLYFKKWILAYLSFG